MISESEALVENPGHGEMVVQGDTDPCCSWIQESIRTPAGTPGKRSKVESQQTEEGSKIMLLCPSKCYLGAQGNTSLGKSQLPSTVHGVVSRTCYQDRSGQGCNDRDVCAPRQRLREADLWGWHHPTWEPVLWALPSARDQKESTCYHLQPAIFCQATLF